jgi:lipopolysaccharide assembly outer membrane protein LptD (OstA)
MIRTFSRILRSLSLLAAVPAFAQAPPSAPPQGPPTAQATAPGASASAIPGFSVAKQFRLDRLSEHHWRATGQVEMQKDDLRFFADVADFYADKDLLEASGNVVVVTRDSRFAAERIEFDMKRGTGVFYEATGVSTVTQRKLDRSLFGTQEPDAYFYGEKIEKLGPRKYRLTKGGFTTCVQPTPRWEMVATSATITLDKYALMRNAVLKVKGVPLFYVPALWYPIKKDDRATGFLIPMYGTSLVRGSSISNAFFWAINRSADLTLMHDWYTRTGQGTGAEYRHITEPGSEAQARFYMLREHEAEYAGSDGGTTTTPERRSYEVRVNAVQRLPASLRARANVDYFSNVTVQQAYFGNLYDASRRQRNVGANLSGSWGAYSASGTFSRSEVFYGSTDSTVNGTAPRISLTRAQRKVGPTPVYFGANLDFSQLVRIRRTEDAEIDQGMGRLDFAPTVRAPFTRWPFFTVSPSLTWRATRYAKSLDEEGELVEEPVFRQYLDARAEFVGPTFTRIWDTPRSGYSERMKHVIEPAFSLQRTTLIENYDRIPKLDSVDYTYGGVTRIDYGLTNRLLAKRRATRQARELLSVSVFQSYYTDERASQYDSSYGSSFTGRKPSAFSPLTVSARTLPTDEMSASVRMEYDQDADRFVSMRANGSIAIRDVLQATLGWSRRFVNEARTDNLLDAGSSFRVQQGRFGGAYNFSYDFYRNQLVQQRMTGYYHAQCCGIAFEYQTYAFGLIDPRYPFSRDKRFNVSFTLAGVGTFANFFGALGGGSGTNQRGF